MKISNLDLHILTKSIHTDAEFDLNKTLLENLRELLLWGTYGKDGVLPLKYVPFKDLEADHIEAILKTQGHIDQSVRSMLELELILRAE